LSCGRRFDQDGVDVKNQFKSVAGEFAKDTVEQWSQRLIKNIWKLGARDAAGWRAVVEPGAHTTWQYVITSDPPLETGVRND
jgi:hypothetical protein